MAQGVFINEIHYDNDGADAGERIEIAGPAGTDLTGWSVALYNGSSSQLNVYGTIALSGTLSAQAGGYGFLSVAYEGIQNGSPDGLALVNDSGTVIQFLSYEGVFTAAEGPASGMTSTDIGVEEGSSTPLDYSLQLAGTGTDYTDFAWAGPAPATFDGLNAGQSFGAAPDPVVFINELHYDNTSADSNEGVELAGSADLSLTGYSLVFYNGNGGSEYSSVPLSGIFSDQAGGFGFLFFPESGIQNGAPDGIALVRGGSDVLQFISYEGSFVAADGPAAGMTSEDIGVSEASDSPEGYSLQLTGNGNHYDDFTWAESMVSTYGALNTGQLINGQGGSGEPTGPQEVTIAEARALPLGSEVIVTGILTVTGQLGGPAYIQDETGGIPVFDTQVHDNSSLSIGDEITLTASVDVFQGQVQLGNVSDLSTLSTGNVIAPLTIPLNTLGAHEGELVTILNADFTQRGVFFPNSNYDIQTADGTGEVRIDLDVTGLVGKVIPPEPSQVTGVVGSFQGTPQLLPRFEDDLPAATPYVAPGNDIPYSTTLDVGTWNMEFFGATLDGYGPSDEDLQLANAIDVVRNLNVDILAVQEVSEESQLENLVTGLGSPYDFTCSDKYSYSFEGPDPDFPAQKVCFIYNSEVIRILEKRAMFDAFFTQIRTSGDASLLPGYPVEPDRFWSSGRLPYLVRARATVGGKSEDLILVDIHAKSGGSSKEDYDRRVYDAAVLKDSLDAFYGDQPVIVLGDYNDDVVSSIYNGLTSPYEGFVTSPDYRATTLPLSEAGFQSYLFGDELIDNMIISNELYDNYLDSTTSLFIPFNLIENYANTTSDHLPVTARFELAEPLEVTIQGASQVFYGYAPEECTSLTASVTGGTGEYSYLWSTGDTTPTINYCPSSAGEISVTVTDERGGTGTASRDICVTDVSCGNGWFADKVLVCFQRNRIHLTLCTPEWLAPLFFKLGASLGSCSDEGCEKSSAGARMNDSATNRFLSIDDLITVQDGELRFLYLGDGSASIQVINTAGQTMRQLNAQHGSFGELRTMAMPSLPRGMYMIRLIEPDGTVYTKKVMF